MLVQALASLGRVGIQVCAAFGRAGLMLFNALVGKPELVKQWPLLRKQLYSVGVQSLLIIMVSGVFIGMVLGLQGYLVLTTYSAEASLGMMVALSLLRELGPVVTALLFAGRASSALTAEIRADEGHRAAIQYGDDGGGSAAPRRGAALWAGVITMPLLTVILSPSASGVGRWSAWTGRASTAAFSGRRCRTRWSGRKTCSTA